MQKINLKKGILIIFVTNIINLTFKVLLNFILPKYLSVSSYADYKYFQMLVSYIGILHLGYIDGIYLKIGGKSISEIDQRQLKCDFTVLFIFQFILSFIMITIAVFLKEYIFFLATIIILPTQIITFYKYVYQATGEYKKYSKILNTITILNSCVVFLLIVLKVKSGIYYILSYCISTFFVWISLLCITKLVPSFFMMNIRTIFSCLKEYIELGSFIMLGNFATTFLTGMDRWFIKILMDDMAFALYSFAVSIVSFLSIAVSPFAITLYNYFCNHNDKQTVINLFNKICFLSFGIAVSFFPAKWVLEHYLQNYIGATHVLSLLYASQMIHIIIVCIYQNLYKALKMQKQYSFRMISMVIIGAVSNGLLFLILRTKESFAIATLLTTLIWLFMCMNDFPLYKIELRKKMFFISELIVFLIASNLFNSTVGLIVYLGEFVLLSLLAMRYEFISAIRSVRIGSRLNKH